MRRTVDARVTCQVGQTADMVWSVAVAHGPVISDETLAVTVGGVPMVFDEVAADAGARLHVVRGVPPGPLELTYHAVVEGQADPAEFSTLDDIVYRRPSRYCDSDTLYPFASAQFAGLEGKALLDAVTSWVGGHLAYVPGSSRPSLTALRNPSTIC